MALARLVVISLATFFCGTLLAGNIADTVLLNGKILTVDQAFSTEQALAIKEGRIIGVGSNTEIKQHNGLHSVKTT